MRMCSGERGKTGVARVARVLTQKQERFCTEYLKCGNATKAYRIAYDKPDMKMASANRRAKDLIDNSKIQARLETLREPVVRDCRVTLGSHLKRLEELSRLAQEEGQTSAAVKAEELRGKACGLYIERREVSQKIAINADFGIDDTE